MSAATASTRRGRLLNEYGMVLVLLLLVVSFSVLTVTDTQNSGAAAGQELSAAIQTMPAGRRVAIFTPQNVTGVQLAEALHAALGTSNGGHEIVGTVHGSPPEVGEALRGWNTAKTRVDVIACPNAVAELVADRCGQRVASPSIGGNCRVVSPISYRWPAFLKQTEHPQHRSADLDHRDHRDRHDARDHHRRHRPVRRQPDRPRRGHFDGAHPGPRRGARSGNIRHAALCGLAGIAACAACGFFSGCVRRGVSGCRRSSSPSPMMLMARGLAMTITELPVDQRSARGLRLARFAVRTLGIPTLRRLDVRALRAGRGS